MKEYPTIQTKHLFLRPFIPSDANEAKRLGGDLAVVDTLFELNLCTPGAAQDWIRRQHDHFEKGEWVNFAITDGESGRLMGSTGLDIDRWNHRAEIIYWFGKEYWGRGYATEAARAVLAYGFNELHLHRIYARFMRRNLASCRVLAKIGMTWEGCLRQHLKKHGVYEDIDVMGILKQEFMKKEKE